MDSTLWSLVVQDDHDYNYQVEGDHDDHDDNNDDDDDDCLIILEYACFCVRCGGVDRSRWMITVM